MSRSGVKDITARLTRVTRRNEEPSNRNRYRVDNRQPREGFVFCGPRGRRGERPLYQGPKRPTPLLTDLPPRRGLPTRKETAYKIRVPHGGKYGAGWVIQLLSRQEIDHFKPLLIRVNEKNEVEFHLKSEEAAKAVKFLNKRLIHTETNDKIILLMNPVPAPWQPLSKKDSALVKKVVDTRYDTNTKSLSLAKFDEAPEFKAAGAKLNLTMSNVMLEVIDHIDEKYGNIIALSLEGGESNKLRHLDFASTFVTVCKFITVLDLSGNSIASIDQLEKLRGLPVKTLFLEGNPICEQYTNTVDYLNAVRGVFPLVTKLDGVQYGPPNNMDIPEDQLRPDAPVKGDFYKSPEVQQLLNEFLTTYFGFYDGPQGAATRKKLLQAYHPDNSAFTLTIQNLRDTQTIKYHDDELFKKYIYPSHNIMREEKWSRSRGTRIFKGNMEIAVQLAKLPLTKHHRDSFTIDVHLCMGSILGFTIQGLFEDCLIGSDKSSPLNFFSRTFTVRVDNGISILSDMLYISAVSLVRLERYRALMKKFTSIEVSDAATSAPSDDIKKQMVETFSQQSGMNLHYSQLCLEENGWQYEKAGQAFLDARPSIPQEAFSS